MLMSVIQTCIYKMASPIHNYTLFKLLSEQQIKKTEKKQKDEAELKTFRFIDKKRHRFKCYYCDLNIQC